MTGASLFAGDIIEVTTERLAYGGDAVARHNGLAVFVPLAAPGERLRVRVTDLKKNFARAVVEQVLFPADSRREAPCRYFGECGGCQLQHINYAAQLEAKAGFVRDALERVGRIDWPHEIEIKHAGEFGYRARARIKIERRNEAPPRIGFARAGSRSVCDVASCAILVPELDAALGSLREAVSNNPDLITAPGAIAEINIAAGDSAISFEPQVGGLAGGALSRRVAGFTLRFSPATFFQVNPQMLETLVSEAVGEESGSLAFDLFAGVGLFTLPLARRYQRVIGVESDRRAAGFALENITASKLVNVRVHQTNAALWLEKFGGTRDSAPDLVLLDPPRTGAAETIPHVIARKPSRINYVSCDPTTLARDLRKLLDGGYELRRVVALDMFPQTYHVETVVGLARK
ncbi:MAG TPA: class I SAM-dependent RNA methyltransferase [Blastocatellia bacterium]|nr:class I SAM-dependent RNA methyltransferase [Blastocatellia bacterium]